MICENCGERIQVVPSHELLDATGKTVFVCSPKISRSETAERGLPSTNCSAGAGADAHGDSLINSVVQREKAVRRDKQPLIAIPSIQEVLARRNAIQLERCSEMLTAAGVPDWVELSDSPGVPSNAVTYRLKWFLARRKDVNPSEIDKELQRDMADWEARLQRDGAQSVNAPTLPPEGSERSR